MTRQDFIIRLQFVKQEVLRANELFEAYICIYNKQSTDADLMNWAPGFFNMVFYSFLNQFAAILARLYDDKSSINLGKLRNCFEQAYKNLGLSAAQKEAILKEIDALLDAQSDGVRRLKTLRNKALAHNDKLGLKSDVWTDVAKINIGEYKGMIEAAYEIVCIILSALNLPVPGRIIGIESEVDEIIIGLKNSQF